MSALTSSIASPLVGRLDEREGVLHLVLPRRVGRERVALGIDPLLVQHDELLGDLADRRSHPALGLGEVAATQAVQRGRLAAEYWRSVSIWSDGTYSLSPPL